MIRLARQSLITLYNRLEKAYGPQSWWPADSAFEVMVGAILTQNTAWRNVEQAIAGLKRKDCLTEAALIALTEQQLAQFIRPTGYFRLKARRLKNLLQACQAAGGINALQALDTAMLRDLLLDVNGVGPETADDILLYAFDRPVFIIDVYTRRLFARMELIIGDETYEALRTAVETSLQGDSMLYNEYHALIVRHGKEKCMQDASCQHCMVEHPLPQHC